MKTNTNKKTETKTESKALVKMECLNIERVTNTALLEETAKLDKVQAQFNELLTKTDTKASELRKQAAMVLDRVFRSELYKKDGFKNITEYAETIGLSLGKTSYSQMCKAGRVYNDKTAPEAIRKLPYSVLAELPISNDSDRKQVYADAAKLDGTNQKDARKYRQDLADNKPQDGKVTKLFTLTINGKPWTMELDGKTVSKFTKEEVDEAVKNFSPVRKDGRKLWVEVDGDKANLIEAKPVVSETKNKPVTITLDEVKRLTIVMKKYYKGEKLTESEQALFDKTKAAEDEAE